MNKQGNYSTSGMREDQYIAGSDGKVLKNLLSIATNRGHDMTSLQQYKPTIMKVAAKHGATNVRFFGSFATGTQTSTSDIDLLVNLDSGRDLLDLIGFKQELEEQTGRKVDVVTENGLSPHLRETILRQAKAI